MVMIAEHEVGDGYMHFALDLTRVLPIGRTALLANPSDKRVDGIRFALQGPTNCQAAMLALWDSENKTTAAIDLWTREMTIDDMNLHVYQVIHKLADTYWRATKDREIADVIHEFGNGFGKTLGLPNSGIGGVD